MLLTDARRQTRIDDAGELVLLADQDRSRWDRGQIFEGLDLVREATNDPSPGRFALQAAIAGVHAAAATADETDWPQIVSLYDALLQAWPSPVVSLNRAASIAMADGPQTGLAALDQVASDVTLRDYHYVPAARADLLRKLGRDGEAAEEYRRALNLVGNEVERRYLERRLAEVSAN
jgi:RNA polymerase sigma-70 factor (ECF subfamily)